MFLFADYAQTLRTSFSAPLKHLSCPQQFVALVNHSILLTDPPYAIPITQKIDSASVEKELKEIMRDPEMEEVLCYVRNVMKVMPIMKVGVQSNLVKVLGLRVLSASMVAWELTGIERTEGKTEDSKIVRTKR